MPPEVRAVVEKCAHMPAVQFHPFLGGARRGIERLAVRVRHDVVVARMQDELGIAIWPLFLVFASCSAVRWRKRSKGELTSSSRHNA